MFTQNIATSMKLADLSISHNYDNLLPFIILSGYYECIAEQIKTSNYFQIPTETPIYQQKLRRLQGTLKF